MYEKLLNEAHEQGLEVIEKYPFRSPRIRGLCCDNTIALSAQIDTRAERTVVLCEELTHATYTVGNILHDPRLERRVRERMFDRLVGKQGLVKAFLGGCREVWELAEWFGVPAEFMAAALQNYRARFGTFTTVKIGGKTYSLAFEPTLHVECLGA